ncbi:MAG: malectin domain-containing carbohydrate-binding protein [Pseudomonadota bacterium]
MNTVPEFGFDPVISGYGNPTSLQFVTGPNGEDLLITSQQDGTLTIWNVTSTGTGSDKDFSASQVFETQIIKTINNHDDDGTLNTSVNNRQVTGLLAEFNETTGQIELYVSSSDPRIGGGGGELDDKPLDTNSGVLSKVTIDLPSDPTQGGSGWNAGKIDLLRGIPRSEENHSVNGMDFTPDGTLLLQVGGFTNTGAPSQNLVYTPEYFLSGAILEVDVATIEAMQTSTDIEGQDYKYDLPTLGILRGERGGNVVGENFSKNADNPWGGNDGYNQAYLEPGGPVDLFATGFRNAYDLQVIEIGPDHPSYRTDPDADNFIVYTWDNGANNNWGNPTEDKDGNPITINNPQDADNIPVFEDNEPIAPGAQDQLHLVERGGYYGHPAPSRANPEAALYLKPEVEAADDAFSENAILAPEFLDDQDNRLGLWDFLPDGVADPLNGYIPGPLEGYYLKPQTGNSGEDVELVLNNGSTNGIVIFEYDPLEHPSDLAQFDGQLFATGFDEQILRVEFNADGSIATNRADIEANNAWQISQGSNPLDIAVGPGGSIWVAAHGGNNIFAYVPGAGETIEETNNDDDDNLFDNLDPFQLDPDNGLGANSRIAPGQYFDFTMDNIIGAPNGLDGFALGFTGHAVNYNTEYFTNESGVIKGGILDGGIAGKLQIEFDAVGNGTAEGEDNDLTYALQTGLNFDDESKKILIESKMTNPWSAAEAQPGQAQGVFFGTGTQFDYAMFNFGINDQGGAEVQITIEINDTVAYSQTIAVPDLATNIDANGSEMIMRVIIDREANTVTPSWEYQTLSGLVTGQAQAISLNFDNDVNTFNNLEEAINGAANGGFLARGAPENGEQSSIIFGDLQTEFTIPLGLAVGINGRVDALGTDPNGTTFAPEFDNLLISASDADGNIITPDTPSEREVVYRVNAGSDTIAAIDGDLDWIGDTTPEGQVFLTGLPGDVYSQNLTNQENEINLINVDADNTPWQLFVHERYSVSDPNSPPTFDYDFAVTTGKTYEVTIYYTENFNNIFASDVPRIFDVSVEDFVPAQFDDINPLQEAIDYIGSPPPEDPTNAQKQPYLGVAFAQTYTYTAQDGVLDITFIGQSENPKINAIEIAELIPDINDPEPNPITLSINDIAVVEGNDLSFTVSLSENALENVAVTYQIVPGTAVATIDYSVAELTPDENGVITGVVTIAANTSSQQIVVSSLDDDLVNESRDFTVALTAVSDTDIIVLDDLGLGAIDNDDISVPPVTERTVLYRVNAGSGTIEAIDDGPDWIGDTTPEGQLYLTGLPGSTFSQDLTDEESEIDLANVDGNSVPWDVFVHERYENNINPETGTLDYDFAVTAGKTYEVTLYYTENFHNIFASNNPRIFDVSVEGVVPSIFEDINPLQEAIDYIGTPPPANPTDEEKQPFLGVALSKTFVYTAEDDVLDISFLKETQNPKINAIEIAEVEIAPDTIGSAVLSVMPNVDNIQQSNYGNNSFQITNTGEKQIAEVIIDVNTALYPDIVFDPEGIAGDSVAKALQIDTDGGTGVLAPNQYTPYIGAGGSAGYKGLRLVFDENTNEGFQPGETLGFSIDMDPNSIAGSSKSAVDTRSNPDWDVGGVSGAEMIGSMVTIVFTDGTTATGQLQSTGTQAGSQALASQDVSNLDVTITVNGLDEGGLGTYDDAGPSVIINGPAGETARVVLTKGFIQPAVDLETLPQQLQDQLNGLAGAGFPANNAVEFQIFDVVLTGADQDISNLFDVSGVNIYDFDGDDALPLGFVAGIIDTENSDLPLGPVTQPIYLQKAAPVVPINATIGDLVVTEGQELAFNISLSEQALDPVTITYEIVPGTALPDVDYTVSGETPDQNGIITGSVTVAANSADQSIFVQSLGDDLVNGSRAFTVNLTGITGTNAVILDGTATGTIQDDDVDIPDPSSGVLDVFLIDSVTDQVIQQLFDNDQLDFSLIDGKQVTIAAYLNPDAELPGPVGSIELDFNNGTAKRIESVEPYALFGDFQGDFYNGISLSEGAQNISFNLYGNGEASGPLLTEEISLDFEITTQPGQIKASVEDQTVTEGEDVTFDIALSAPADEDITITYEIQPGSAVAGSDYSVAGQTPDQNGIITGSLVIAASQTQQSISIQTIDDAIENNARDFSIQLTSISGDNTVLDQATASATIIDNDAPVPVGSDNLNVFVIDANTDQVLTELFPNDQLDFSLFEGKNVSFAAYLDPNSSFAGQVGSVALDFNNGAATRVEGVEPYALFGDFQGDFYGGLSLNTGAYDVSFTLYGQSGAAGDPLTEQITYDFNIV